MTKLYDKTCHECSKVITKNYSTSFSMGIYSLDKKLQLPIYSIYGFVRLADEIVDSFNQHNQNKLLDQFKKNFSEAINNKISLNPILHSFQATVHEYRIDLNLIKQFIHSMSMDLEENSSYSNEKYKLYILGSAEVVGLMCLQVFVNGNKKDYELLKPYAKKLGSAFQKINFLRDLKSDFTNLGRVYFPNVDLNRFTEDVKAKIEKDINQDFEDSYEGILQLPKSARGGVLLAYMYYKDLFFKIKHTSASRILKERIRISNSRKIILMIQCLIKNKFNIF